MKRIPSHVEAGFALLEILVALTIMAIVGLLAWRGMDAMMRGRQIIEQRANTDQTYLLLVRQFERDCQAILHRSELMIPQGLSSIANGGASVGSNSVPTIAAGLKNIWWMRRYHIDNQDAWLLVGYGVTSEGLQRWASHPLFNRKDALSVWNAVLQEPDLLSSNVSVTWTVYDIVKQAYVLQTIARSSADVSNTSTSPVTQVSTIDSNTNLNNGTISFSPASNPRGLILQWWLKEASFPITRKCLLGGAL